MRSNLEIQEFFIKGSDEEASHVLLHIAEPVTREEKENGYFFALVEILHSYPEQIGEMQEIIEDIETAYYERKEIEESTLEEILQDINHRTHYLLSYNGSKINAIVGTIRGKKLTLAYHGNPTASLFYSSENNLKETKIISEKDREETSQLFSAVVDGDIKNGDFVYIATPKVSDHFHTDRVCKIIQSRNTEEAALHIQKVLDNIMGEFSFGGIILHIPQDAIERVYNKQDKDMGSQASMDSFLNTKKSTAETLSPSFFKNLKQKTGEIIKRPPEDEHVGDRKKRMEKMNKKRGNTIETNYRSRNRQTNEKWSEKILIAIGKTLVFLAKTTFFTLKKIILLLLIFLSNLFYFVTNKNGRRTFIITDTRNKIKDIKYQIKNISLVSKVIFIALILLAGTFIGSIIYLRIKENHEAQVAQYNNLLESIIEKKDDAEARLIYGEEGKALEIINEAKNLLHELPQKEEEEIITYNELSAQVDEILNKLQKMTSVDSILVADLGVDTADKLAMLENDLYVFGTKDPILYQINPVTGAIEQKSHDTITGLHASDTPKEQDKILFLNQASQYAEYTSDTGTISARDIAYPVDDPHIIDMAIYNRNMYTLDPQNDQIYKHNPTQTGYSRGEAWITEKDSSLSDAIALSVDGDIFVLTSGGHILRFFGGEEQGYTIAGLYPELTSPTQIWTYSNTDNIYVLESSSKRVVILDKEGDFVAQYTSDQWQAPTDMIVSEEEKTIYVLDSGKVYSFEF